MNEKEFEKWEQRKAIVNELMNAALRVQDAIFGEVHDFDNAVENWKKLKKRLDEI